MGPPDEEFGCVAADLVPVGPSTGDLQRAPYKTEDSTWTSDGFGATWGKVCGRARIDDVIHELCGSMDTRLALAGVDVPENASLTWHSLKDIRTILDAKYLDRNVRLTEAEMRKRERKETRTETVK
mgnify:CR=1 FL=1|jgi:hypothetical protein